MISLADFSDTRLPGGFVIVSVELAQEPMVEAMGREAAARARITGRNIEITIWHGLDEKECSVSLYHEVLEAMTVACDFPPESVLEFIESDFEIAAHEAHERFGLATPENVKRMLQSFGFREA